MMRPVKRTLNYMVPVILALILTSIGSAEIQAQKAISTAPTPRWVEPIEVKNLKPDTKKISEGYYFKLLDFQLHAEHQVAYNRVVREIVNESGVQYGSDIYVDFSPDYQQLIFHTILVIRDGRRIDALDVNKFKVVAMEQEAASFVYDGRYYAYLVLDDVRVGDQIEYSYSITGRNPVFEDRLFKDIYLQGSVPIAQLYTSILASSLRKLQIKTFNDAPGPDRQISGSLTRYSWARDLVDAVPYETYTPAWVDTYQHVQLSEYPDWGPVGAWALRINAVPDRPGQGLATKADELLRQAGNDSGQYAHAAIRFVQDDIRYTSVSIGEYSHRAHSPDQVLRQRYGDCKDKSLLLVALLRHAGIEAYVALVNTGLQATVMESLPSPAAFDHAIVYFELNQRPYWTDPTISHQGGDLDSRHLPPYGRALVLNGQDNDLTAIRDYQPGKVEIEERYTSTSAGETRAGLVVTSTYTGHEADQMRAQLAYTSLWDLERSYLDYYSRLYPEIEPADSLHVDDNREQNLITLREYYDVPSFMTVNSNGILSTELYAQFINDRLPDIPATKTTPIAVNYPSDIDYRIVVISPEGWQIRPSSFMLDRDHYVYGNSMNAKADTLTIYHSFRYHKTHIPPSGRAEFAADIRQIKENELSTSLTYGGNASDRGGRISWTAVVWSMLILALVTGLGRWLYRRPFPPKAIPGDDQPVYDRLGGWLILPLIGFCLTPFMIIFSLPIWDYLYTNVWNAYSGTGSDMAYRVMVAFELTINVLLIGWSVMLVVFMIHRKAILPRLALLFYAIGILQPLILITLLFMFDEFGGALLAETIVLGLRSLILGAIWGSYFLFSKRVRRTFVIP